MRETNSEIIDQNLTSSLQAGTDVKTFFTFFIFKQKRVLTFFFIFSTFLLLKTLGNSSGYNNYAAKRNGFL